MVLGCLIPVALVTQFIPRLRSRFTFFFPLGVLLYTTIIGIAASLIGLRFGTGWERSLLVILVSIGICVSWLFAASLFDWKLKTLPSLSSLAIFGVLALAAVSDELVILAKNRWDFEANFLFPSKETYFRFPFNSDNRRHAILVSTVLRDGDSPFLAKAEMRYHLHWYYLASVFVGPFRPISFQAYVQGATLATSFSFSSFCFGR